MQKRRFLDFFQKRSADHTPRRGLPPVSYILFGLAVVCGVIYLVAMISQSFAGWFHQTVAAFFRALLAHLTSWLPFSLAEILLFSLPLWVLGLILYIWRFCSSSWRAALRFFCILLSVLSLFFSTFVLTFGVGYHTRALDVQMGLSADAVSAEELKATAELLAAAVNEAAKEVIFGEDGFSQMPYDLREMNDLLLEAYDAVCERYDFIQSLKSRVKPVAISHAMSYTHITGIYSYFTGEANINVYFPCYTVVYTAAHELAHQRGISRENEANFVAFLATEASEDPYIRYCGYLNLFEYVVYALYSADAEAYRAVMNTLSKEVRGELRAYSNFFEEFRDSAAADVSDAVNDTFIKVNGDSNGVASYGLVVDLAVSYLHSDH